MFKELNLTVNEEITLCKCLFSYFKEDGEVIIQIDWIEPVNSKSDAKNIDLTELLTEEQIEDIKYQCQVHYEKTAFEYWEQRYEERNSGLSRY